MEATFPRSVAIRDMMIAVQMKWASKPDGWQTIACFDCAAHAIMYKAECDRVGDPERSYRIITLSGNA